MKTKFVIVTGGVLSGLGKGIASASIARLMKNGKKIVTVKCDGYLNVDPGTMNPIEHGEVFVLEDGGEVDMDFGHYERFLGQTCKFDWNITSGKIFNRIIQKERRGEFLGKTIQIIPHVPLEVKNWWFELAEKEQADIMLIEVGGTVGDMENPWYIEAARQLKKDLGSENVIYIHLTYIPFLDSVGELKTKPAQRDVALLHEKGIRPDVILARAKEPLSKKLKEKLAIFCDVHSAQIISLPDTDTVYEIPLLLKDQGVYEIIKARLLLEDTPNLENWGQLVNKIKNPEKEVTIALCGKYTELQDSYASVIEALTHAGAHLNSRVNIKWVDTTDVEQGKKTVAEILHDVQGVLVPGGFGDRGTEGKIKTVQFARENNIPYLGICYGLQLAVVEFARNVCNLRDAHSTEIDPATTNPVIDILPEQKEIKNKGGTMRLGAYTADLVAGTKICKLYNDCPKATERHRHRYEVNPEYHAVLQKYGMLLSGTSQSGRIAEFIELKDHPFFVASQAHNELTSRLETPNPLFYGFVDAALTCKSNQPHANENKPNPNPPTSAYTLTQ